MKWTSATALIAALSAAAAGTTYVVTRRPVGPAEIVRGVRREMDSVTFQQRAALAQLDVALTTAENRRDDELKGEILQTRSEVYLQLGDEERALEDLKRIEALRPGDFAHRLRIAELMKTMGDQAEAINEVNSILAERPRDAAAWALLGELEAAEALSLLQVPIEEIKKGLVREEAEVTIGLLVSLACREANDPELPNLEFELGAFVPTTSKDLLYGAQLAVPGARERFHAARAAFARSIALDPTVDRVLALGASLTAAGQEPETIRLLRAALSVPTLSGSGPIRFELLRLLSDAGRIDEARAEVRQTAWRTVTDLEHVNLAARLLYQAGDYGMLGRLANRMNELDGNTGRYWLSFYQSVPAIHRFITSEDPLSDDDKVAAGKLRKELRNFISNEKGQLEPFAGARAEAGYWFAKLATLRGDRGDEIFGLNIGFSGPGSQTADGKVQLARALQQSKSRSWIDVELALSDAIDLAPDRTAEFIEEWREAGLKNIKSKGMTINNLLADARTLNSAVPAVRGLGPAAYTLLAEKHLEEGRNYSALQAANLAMEDHPKLIPAMDVAIAAKVATPNRYNVERDLVRRIRLAGMDESVERILGMLPGQRLEGPDLMEAIKVAPERFGKPAVARWFLENGDSKSARAALGEFDSNSAPYSMRLLRAQTLYEEQSNKSALDVIKGIESTGLLGAEAALLKARLLLELGQLSAVPQVVTQLDLAEASPSAYLQLADLLMAKGQATLALEIVERLDQDPKTRTPEFYRRRILVDILTARERGGAFARESIDRSEAYLRDGTPEIASILLAVSRRKWTELPAQIARLRRSSFQITPQKEVALILLAERLEAGRRMSQEQLQVSPRDPMWALAAAAGDAMVKDPIALPAWFGQSAISDAERLLVGSLGRSSRDPRETLALILVVDRPEWAPWLLPIIDKVAKESGSGIWTNYLRAVALEASGDPQRLAVTIDRLVQKHNRFGPAHDWAVELAKTRHPDEPLKPEVVRARRVRLLSLGEELIDDPVEIALANAGRLANLQKDNVAASQALQAVLGAAGDAEVEARLILGILKARERQYSSAAEFLFQAAMDEPGVFREVVINSLRGCLIKAAEALTRAEGEPKSMSAERIREMLDELQERYPLDPMVILTRLELSGIPRDGWGAFAENALGDLYKNSGREPLEALRRGSTRPWVKLLIEVKVELAREIVERDLAHEPGNLELWDLRAWVAQEMDDDEAAEEIYRGLLATNPSGDVGYSLAEIMISRGAPVTEVLPVIAAADAAAGGPGPRSTFLKTLAQSRHLPMADMKERDIAKRQAPKYVATREQKIDEYLKRLALLWGGKDVNTPGLDDSRIGGLYLDLLHQRNADFLAAPVQDRKKIRAALKSSALEEVTKDLIEAEDRPPYREAALTAVAGLHRKAFDEAEGL